jgi:A/G-specific adenine glycosylase
LTPTAAAPSARRAQPVTLSAARTRGLRHAVLLAGDGLWRDLPWRRTRDPWHVLVSEVMLQQTQAGRVVAPFLAFVSQFPTATACAGAGAADVVRAWAGLGYNRRAVNLHRAAAVIRDRHGGVVPADLASLRALPGVGEYTARAVLAFAFEAPVGVVDTNVVRVLARAVAGRPLRSHEAQQLADRLVAPAHPWRFNQALFDLGAQVCTAQRPRCGACPLRRRCRWANAPAATPDPAAKERRQPAFAGSDRQGRGRLVAALRGAPLAAHPGQLARAAGWPGDPERALRAAESLVADGIAQWDGASLRLA